MLGFVFGSGFEDFVLDNAQTVQTKTPFGETEFDLGDFHGTRVAVLHRHGKDHRFAPHQIPSRAQIWALKEAGVTEIIAVASVGGMAAENAPGHFTVPDQIVDYTYGRECTYWGEAGMPMQHIDFTRPFDESLREKLLQASGNAKVYVHPKGTYACTQGPRLETAAEVRRMIMDGCDMVGMTAMPEAALAKELGIRYAMICFSVNWAAGLVDDTLDFAAIKESMKRSVSSLQSILANFVQMNSH